MSNADAAWFRMDRPTNLMVVNSVMWLAEPIDFEEVKAVLKLLLAEGRAVRVSAELYFDAAALAALEARLVAHLEEHQAITTQEFKELVGATRKHVIPLAEHFDRVKVTLRVGERRVLRGERKS